MKIIIIGRGEDANIRIENEMISRRHASIKLLPFGKMEIRDLSKNGTFINGVRIAPNKFHKVTRKDIVSFAKVSQLDWNEVPDQMRPYRIAALALAASIVLLLCIVLIPKISIGSHDETEMQAPVENPTPAVAKEPAPPETPKAEKDDNTKKNDIPSGESFFPKKKKDKKGKTEENNNKEGGKDNSDDKSQEPDPATQNSDQGNYLVRPM